MKIVNDKVEITRRNDLIALCWQLIDFAVIYVDINLAMNVSYYLSNVSSSIITYIFCFIFLGHSLIPIDRTTVIYFGVCVQYRTSL